MAQVLSHQPSQSNWKRRVAWFLLLLDILIVGGVILILFKGVTPGSAASPSLLLVQDVALPSVALPPPGHAPLAAVPFDRFDFQALDSQSGLLFIAHPGPSANKAALSKKQLPAG